MSTPVICCEEFNMTITSCDTDCEVQELFLGGHRYAGAMKRNLRFTAEIPRYNQRNMSILNNICSQSTKFDLVDGIHTYYGCFITQIGRDVLYDVTKVAISFDCYEKNSTHSMTIIARKNTAILEKMIIEDNARKVDGMYGMV